MEIAQFPGKVNWRVREVVFRGIAGQLGGLLGGIGEDQKRAAYGVGWRGDTSPEAVANEIAAKGGLAHTTVIDTSNDAAVTEYLDGIVKQTDKIDIVLDFAVPLAKEFGS
jgi:hypothetical protein